MRGWRRASEGIDTIGTVEAMRAANRRHSWLSESGFARQAVVRFFRRRAVALAERIRTTRTRDSPAFPAGRVSVHFVLTGRRARTDDSQAAIDTASAQAARAHEQLQAAQAKLQAQSQALQSEQQRVAAAESRLRAAETEVRPVNGCDGAQPGRTSRPCC